MRTRSNRLNNGYIGDYNLVDRDNGVLSNQKIYQQALIQKPDGVIGEYLPNSYGIISENYQRPSEWIDMPSVVEGEDKFAGVYAVYDNDSNWVSFTFSVNSGTYTVDWGDGTSSTVSSGAAAYKQYTRATYSALTSTVFRKYKTLKITVTPTTIGSWFTTINLLTTHNQSGLALYYSNGWLDIKMSAPKLTAVFVSGTNQSSYTRASKLEQFDFIGNSTVQTFQFTGAQSLRRIVNFPSTRNNTAYTDWSSRFHTCHSLQEFPARMLDGISLATTTNYLFYYCFSLKSVPPMDTRNATTMQQMFESCKSLRRIPYLNTSKATNLYGIFSGCFNLQTAPELDTRVCQNLGYAYGSCYSLKKYPSSFGGTSFTNLSGLFSNTRIINGPTFGGTSNVTTYNSMFAGAQSLISVPQYDFSKATDIRYMFRYCYDIKVVPDMNTTSLLTEALQAFEFCPNLNYAPGITLSNVTNITGMYNGCYNLNSVPSTNLSNITTLTNLFNTCYSLADCGFTGIKDTFSVSGCGMGPTALNNLYTSLATVVGKTITVTGNWGTASDNPSIATSKGWTVTG